MKCTCCGEREPARTNPLTDKLCEPCAKEACEKYNREQAERLKTE